MKTLITGGTGFIGSALVRALNEGDRRVRVLDDDSRGNWHRISDLLPRVEFVKGDVRSPNCVFDAAYGCDRIIHLAYINGTAAFYERPTEVLDIAVKGMMNVVNACLRFKIPELFLCSSSEVYQNPPVVPTPEDVPLTVPDLLNPRYSYGGGKILSELLAVNYGRLGFKRVVIFRPHNVYGPDMGHDHVIPQLSERIQRSIKDCPHDPVRIQIQGTGDETRAFCFVDDCISGIMKVLDKGEHLNVYNVGTDAETPIGQLAGMIGAWHKRVIRTVPGPLQPGSPFRRCPDVSKLKALGWNPLVSLSEGLDRTLTWYKENCK